MLRIRTDIPMEHPGYLTTSYLSHKISLRSFSKWTNFRDRTPSGDERSSALKKDLGDMEGALKKK